MAKAAKKRSITRRVFRILLRTVLLVLVTSIVVGLVVGWGLITVLTQPVRDLTRVARRVQQGDLSQRAPVWADDDIGELVRTFNAMMDSLVQSNTSLDVLRGV